jgi:hypothetical protein
MKKLSNIITSVLATIAFAATIVSCEEDPENTVPVASVTVEPATLSLTVGDTSALTATVLPENANDKIVTWSSSDESVAKVNPSSGEVVAIASGSATITAGAANQTTGNCTVTVTEIETSASTVYVAGNITNSEGLHVATVWINGEVLYTLSDSTDLTKISTANSIFVSGSDIYVAGDVASADYMGDGLFFVSSTVAAVWKNGVEQTLSDGVEYASMAQSVYVSGNDVYVAGLEGKMNTRIRVARVWKNNVVQTLSDSATSSVANSVFVSGDDVYVAGSSILWKNGVKHYTTGSSGTSSVFVSGNDIYTTGYENSLTAGVWKNNEILYLFYDSKHPYYRTCANSVYVSGNDVYVAGYEIRDSGYVAMLWKNGTAQNLDGQTSSAVANSVFVLGNDVYVAGRVNSMGAVWKNGNIRILQGTGNSEAYSVFVK